MFTNEKNPSVLCFKRSGHLPGGPFFCSPSQKYSSSYRINSTISPKKSMSNETTKGPWLFFGKKGDDYTTQLCGDSFIKHYKDPY